MQEESIALEKRVNRIGIDLGIKEFMVTSESEHVENPRVLRMYEEKYSDRTKKTKQKEAAEQ